MNKGIRSPRPQLPRVPRPMLTGVHARPRSVKNAPWMPGNSADPKGNPSARYSVIGNRHSADSNHARVPVTYPKYGYPRRPHERSEEHTSELQSPMYRVI